MKEEVTKETDSDFYDNDYGDDDILHQILINKLMITMNHWRLLKQKMMHGLSMKTYNCEKNKKKNCSTSSKCSMQKWT
jgi:hypothetical protein